jgi:phosphoglycolate phosphatase
LLRIKCKKANKTLKISSYSHIIWDWNGTLLNDVELCADVFSNLLNKYNLPSVSVEEYRDIFTFPVKHYYEKAGLDFSKYSFEKLGKEWMDEYELRKNTCMLFGDTIVVLEYIKKKNIPQSILSAYPRKTLIEIIRLMQIESFFKYIYGLDHIYATGKKELGAELIKQINTDGRILFIGDTDHDFEVAESIGADCILISNGHQGKEKLLSTGAMVLDNISELMSL